MAAAGAPVTHGVAAPPFSTAGRFVEGVAARDFAHLASALDEQVTLRALLPSGPMQATGAAGVVSAFRRWFGEAAEFELADASVGVVCDRLHLHWRVRLRTGAGRFTVEQHAYADAGGGDLITGLDLLCSGYRPELGDD